MKRKSSQKDEKKLSAAKIINSDTIKLPNEAIFTSKYFDSEWNTLQLAVFYKKK